MPRSGTSMVGVGRRGGPSGGIIVVAVKPCPGIPVVERQVILSPHHLAVAHGEGAGLTDIRGHIDNVLLIIS